MPLALRDGRTDVGDDVAPLTLTVTEIRGSGGVVSASIDADWRDFYRRSERLGMYCSPHIVAAIARGLGQIGYCIEAYRGRVLAGGLPLVHLRSRLFGSFLVSLPYVSWAGAVADDDETARALVDRAIELADTLDVDFLELRQMRPLDHSALVAGATRKSQMVVDLTAGAEAVWDGLKSEVRTQIRKARKNALAIEWSNAAQSRTCLTAFYDCLAQNMRDLGTPVFPHRLFVELLQAGRGDAEVGVVRLGDTAIAACLAVHGDGLTEIPSAASLRAHRGTAANSLMYWDAIERAIARGQRSFDFGRSTPGSATYVFKRKWGAEPVPVTWQYYLRRGSSESMRPESKRFDIAKRAWQHLPVPVTRVLGPMIVRGIP